MDKCRKILLFLLFFSIFLVWNMFVVDIYADEIWNYGFAHYIYKGLIPYKDFNMVITPFYPVFISLFFHIFGSSILIFHIINALLLTCFTYLLYKLINDKIWIVLILLFIPCNICFPSYNIFLVILFVLLLYLEKNNSNDILIGLVIGISILSKQSVGVFFLLPSLYYIKDIKKIRFRILGILISLFVLLIYLLLNGNLLGFIDLCVLGLFDFSHNYSSNIIVYILSIIYLIICINEIRKNNKNIYNYYSLAAFSFTLPLFDFFHLQCSLFCLLVVLFMNYNIKINLKLPMFFFGVILGTLLINVCSKFNAGIDYPNKINHFEYRLLSTEAINYTEKVNKFLDKYKDREVVFLTNNAYYFRIVRDEDISYVDLINYGNHGYHGSDKLLKLVKDKKDAIFIVDKNELKSNKQTDKRIIRYVLNHGKYKSKFIGYDIYEFR